MSTITAKTCQTCFKKDQCWVVNFDKTYDYMKQIMNETEEGTLQHNRKLVREWDKHCVRGKKVTDLVAGELDHFYEGQKL